MSINETPHFETIAEGLRYREYNATPFPEYLIRERNARLGVFVPLLNGVNTSLEEIYDAYLAVGGKNEPPAELTNEPWIGFWRNVQATDSPHARSLETIWFGIDALPTDDNELVAHPSFTLFAHQGNLLKTMEDGKVQFKKRKMPFGDQSFPYVAHTHIDTPGILLDVYLRENNVTIDELSAYDLWHLRTASMLLAAHDTIEEGCVISDDATQTVTIESLVHGIRDPFVRKLLTVGVPALTESPYHEMVRNTRGSQYPIARGKDVFAALGKTRGILHERKQAIGALTKDQAIKLSKVYQQDLLVYGSHAHQIRAIHEGLFETGDDDSRTIASTLPFAELVDRMSEMMDLERYMQREDTSYYRELTFFHAAKIRYMRSQINQSQLHIFPGESFADSPIDQMFRQHDALFEHKLQEASKITGNEKFEAEFLQYYEKYFMPHQVEHNGGFIDIKSPVEQACGRFDEFAQDKAKVIVRHGL